MLNCTILMGRLVRDPEIRAVGNGTNAANFTLAVERDYAKDGQKETDFIDCAAFGKTADFISKYFTKGRMMAVVGRLQIRNWTDKEGNKRKSTEIIVNNAYFGDSKRDADSGSATTYSANYAVPYTQPDTSAYAAPGDYAVIADDGEILPF